jgi:predicted SprT family Zn-dependent metalloprotease
MQHYPAALPEEHYVTCTKCIVLECSCGERVLLLGRESDWSWEGRTVFECGGCGRELTLEDSR